MYLYNNLFLKFNATGIIKKIGVRKSIKMPHCGNAWGAELKRAFKRHYISRGNSIEKMAKMIIDRGTRNGPERSIDNNNRKWILKISNTNQHFFRMYQVTITIRMLEKGDSNNHNREIKGAGRAGATKEKIIQRVG